MELFFDYVIAAVIVVLPNLSESILLSELRNRSERSSSSQLCPGCEEGLGTL